MLVSLRHQILQIQSPLLERTLGPAKTYILRSTPQTYTTKIHGLGPTTTNRQANRPRKGNGEPVWGTEVPVTGTKPSLNCTKHF